MIQAISPVTAKPTIMQPNSAVPVAPWLVVMPAASGALPAIGVVMSPKAYAIQIAGTDSSADVQNPLYSAPMIESLRPSRTKYVLMIEVDARAADDQRQRHQREEPVALAEQQRDRAHRDA